MVRSEGLSVGQTAIEASLAKRVTDLIGTLWANGCSPEDVHIELPKSTYPTPAIWPMAFGNIEVVPVDWIKPDEFRVVHKAS